LFLGSLALYAHTLAPTVLPADSGEFQLVSYVLGIAHPPGYPLYMLLAKLFTFLPVGDIAYRVNLFAAVTSAVTLVVLARAVRRATGSAAASWVAPAGLAVAPTFWAQSTTANIRSLTALFTALQVYTLIRYAEKKEPRHLLAFAVALGLGITHHSSLIPLILPYLVFLAVSDPTLVRRPRCWLRPLLAFVLSLGVLLYLPVRSWMGAPFDPQPIRNLSGFLEHVLALGFRGDMFYFVQVPVVSSRARVLLDIGVFQFGRPWLLLGVCSVIGLAVRQRRLLSLLGGVFLVNVVLAVTYRAPQTVEYLMPAYVAFAAIAAYGVWFVGHYLSSRRWHGLLLTAVWLAVVLCLPASLLLRNYSSFVQLSRDHSARQYAETVLEQAPPGARILSNWHQATPFWYLQHVEKLRPDVEVVYVYPEGAEPIAQTWLRRLQDSIRQRPTIVTNRYPEFNTVPANFRPLAGAWLVQESGVDRVAATVQPLSALFDQRIELLGCEIESSTLSPADSIVAHVYWRPAIKLERDYSFFVHVVDETGAVVGQGDTTHPAARYEVGQVLLDEYRIPLLPTIRPGCYRLIAGVYITLESGGWRRLTVEDGRDSILLDEVEVQPLDVAPVTRHALFRTADCRYTLAGVDYDHSLPGQLRIYLHWRVDSSLAEPWRVVLFSGEVTLAAAELPRLPASKYFTTAHDLPTGTENLALELQDLAGEKSSRWLGPWRIPLGRRVRLPAASPGDRYVSFGGEMVLLQAQYPHVWAGGPSLPTVMTFAGTRALTHDYTVSVSLQGEADSWQTQHDGTPALGAIPTLKWIRGIVIRDEHVLPLPPGASGNGLLRLTVYDASTMRPLSVLDERLARLGQGTQIDLGSLALH